MSSGLPSELEFPTETILAYYIPGRPQPYDRATSANHRVTGAPIRVHSAAYRSWRSQAARDLATQGRHLAIQEALLAASVLVGADGIELRIHQAGELHRPKGITGDLDNYVKATLDAAQQSTIIKNDRNIVAVRAAFTSRRVMP